MKLMIKISYKIQRICTAAKISVIMATILATALYILATYISFSGEGIYSKYLFEYMGEVATDIFAIGIFLGFSGDILASAVDRNKK